MCARRGSCFGSFDWMMSDSVNDKCTDKAVSLFREAVNLIFKLNSRKRLSTAR